MGGGGSVRGNSFILEKFHSLLWVYDPHFARIRESGGKSRRHPTDVRIQIVLKKTTAIVETSTSK